MSTSSHATYELSHSQKWLTSPHRSDHWSSLHADTPPLACHIRLARSWPISCTDASSAFTWCIRLAFSPFNWFQHLLKPLHQASLLFLQLSAKSPDVVAQVQPKISSVIPLCVQMMFSPPIPKVDKSLLLLLTLYYYLTLPMSLGDELTHILHWWLSVFTWCIRPAFSPSSFPALAREISYPLWAS